MVKRLTFKKFFAMVTEKIRIRHGQLVRQPNWFPFKRHKVLFKRRLWEKFTKPFTQHNIQTLVERDKSGVKRGVVKCRETKPVSRVQALGWKFPPRLDVARNQQARNIDAADAAANIISVENCLTKELLPATNFDCRLGFCRPA